MLLNISDKPILAGILVFFLVLFFLCVIYLLFEAIRKILNRMGDGKKAVNNQNVVESKLYELIFSKKEVSFNELLDYGLTDGETLFKYLNDMIEKEVIVFENNTYRIKR